MNLPATFSEEEDYINVLVETPKGSCNKYVYDPRLQLFQLKKILPSDIVFPLDFGFICSTKAEDGDPLDALVLMEQPTYPGILVPSRAIGILEARQKGRKGKFYRNDRVLLVASDSKLYNKVKEVADMEEYFIKSLNHFFEYYHEQEGGKYIPIGVKGSEDAMSRIKALMTEAA